jgi:hypothetical protein
MLNTFRLFFAALLVLTGISAASAQLDRNAEIRTAIPFEFVAGDQTMPAGEYRITRLATGSELVIRNRKGNAVIVDTLPSYLASTPESTTVDFERVAGEYVLARVRITGSTTASELVKSQKRIVLAKKGAGTDSGASTIN